MRSNFDACTRLILRSEGGYSNNPKDPGGPTFRGVTLATARSRLDASMTAERLKDLSPAQIEAVYRSSYADAIAFDRLPSGLDYALYDYAVNSGPRRANRVVRALVGAARGSSMDADVLAAIARRDCAELVRAVCAERLAFMRSLRAWSTFGKGWAARVAAVERNALALAGDPAPGLAPGVASDLDAVAGLPKATIQRLPRGIASAGPSGIGFAAAIVTGAGAAGSAGFHLGEFAALGLALAAFCAIGVIVLLVDRAGAAAAVEPARGTTIVPPLPLSNPVQAGPKH